MSGIGISNKSRWSVTLYVTTVFAIVGSHVKSLTGNIWSLRPSSAR